MNAHIESLLARLNTALDAATPSLAEVALPGEMLRRAAASTESAEPEVQAALRRYDDWLSDASPRAEVNAAAVHAQLDALSRAADEGVEPTSSPSEALDVSGERDELGAAATPEAPEALAATGGRDDLGAAAIRAAERLDGVLSTAGAMVRAGTLDDAEADRLSRLSAVGVSVLALERLPVLLDHAVRRAAWLGPDPSAPERYAFWDVLTDAAVDEARDVPVDDVARQRTLKRLLGPPLDFDDVPDVDGDISPTTIWRGARWEVDPLPVEARGDGHFRVRQPKVKRALKLVAHAQPTLLDPTLLAGVPLRVDAELVLRVGWLREIGGDGAATCLSIGLREGVRADLAAPGNVSVRGTRATESIEVLPDVAEPTRWIGLLPLAAEYRVTLQNPRRTFVLQLGDER